MPAQKAKRAQARHLLENPLTYSDLLSLSYTGIAFEDPKKRGFP